MSISLSKSCVDKYSFEILASVFCTKAEHDPSFLNKMLCDIIGGISLTLVTLHSAIPSAEVCFDQFIGRSSDGRLNVTGSLDSSDAGSLDVAGTDELGGTGELGGTCELDGAGDIDGTGELYGAGELDGTGISTDSSDKLDDV